MTEQQTSLPVKMVQFILPSLILASGFSVLYAAMVMRPKPKKEERVEQPPTVEVAAIETYEKGLTIEANGTVVPFREIRLATEIGGRIKHKSKECRAGNFVHAGDLLFEIDPIDYELAVRRLKNELRKAEIEIHSSDVELANNRDLVTLAKTDLGLAQKEVARLTPLVGSSIVARSDFDRAQREEVAAQNRLTELTNQAKMIVTKRASQNATMELVGTQLEEAELDLKRSKVLSPIDGVIIEELIEEDAFVQPGTTLLRIEDTNVVEVLCNLRMDQLYWLWDHNRARRESGELPSHSAASYEIPNTPATVTYQVAGREFRWDGMLVRYDGSGVNPRNRMVPCRVVVNDPRKCLVQGERTTSPPALVNGMFVDVSLQVNPDAKLMKIPLKALQPGNRIWRVANNLLNIEQVSVVRLTDDYALIEADDVPFQAGDQLVTTPLPAPQHGMELTVVEPEGARIATRPDTEEANSKDEETSLKGDAGKKSASRDVEMDNDATQTTFDQSDTSTSRLVMGSRES